MGEVYRIRKSAGYVFVQILVLQVAFLLLYAAIVFIGEEADTVVDAPGVSITSTDVLLILFGILLQALLSFILFIHWQRSEYRVYNHEVEVYSNMFGATRRSYQLKNILSYDIRQDMLGKFYGYGSVVMRRQFDDRPIILSAVPEPEQLVGLLKARADD